MRRTTQFASSFVRRSDVLMCRTTQVASSFVRMYCLRLRDFSFNLVRNIAPIFPPVNSSTSFAACGERLADIDATHVVKSNPNASGDPIRRLGDVGAVAGGHGPDAW